MPSEKTAHPAIMPKADLSQRTYPASYWLTTAVLRGINHLLHQAEWASTELQRFTGQSVHVHIGQTYLALSISAAGDLEAATNANTANTTDTAAPHVSIHLPADTPLRALTSLLNPTERHTLFAAAHLSGKAELAETLARIAQHLRWDIEADLAPYLGDILAHRLTRSGKMLLQSTQDSLERLLANLSEYWQTETDTLASPSAIQHFCSEVDQLRDRLARLEARTRHLQHPPRPASTA